ncbi:MAG: type II toxin-antitoxin system RelE/ParE family toxin [Candidatus Parabeggiatoa sp. nov. 2]|nr:MAG: hypothetical protein B6247_17260 [Beggiatoa sp. 4572_84]RKZ58341.1 MAG: type II toxin-antitoxin system RelE/ParE family toxin [Gammaproteobacteria bacterium]
MKEIHFYRTESGSCPVEEFLNSLPSMQAQKVVWVLRLIEEVEVPPTLYFKKSANTEDIWEVRVQVETDIFRLLGFIEDEQVIVLNHAIQKTTVKIPSQELKIAESRKLNYLNRKNAL